jgi:hypothetical protein
MKESSCLSIWWAKYLTYIHSQKKNWYTEYEIPEKYKRLKGLEGKSQEKQWIARIK